MTAMGGTLAEAKKYVDRMRNKRRYMENPEPKKKRRMAEYEADKETQKQGFKDYYDKNSEKRIDKRMKAYEAEKETQKQGFREYNDANKEKLIRMRMDAYEADKETQKQGFRDYYEENVDRFKERYEANRERRMTMYAIKSGRYGPSFPCVVCHELQWLSNVVVIDLDEIGDGCILADYIEENKSLFIKQGSYYCCKTCNKKIDNGQLPRNAAVNKLNCPWDKMPQQMLKHIVRIK